MYISLNMRSNLQVPPDLAHPVAAFIGMRLSACLKRAHTKARSRAIFRKDDFRVTISKKRVVISVAIDAFAALRYGPAAQHNDITRLGQSAASELKFVIADAYAGCVLCRLGEPA